MPQRTEKTEPDAPPNCAVLPKRIALAAAFPRRSVKAGIDRTHKLCFSSVRPSIPGQPALRGGPQRRGARAGGGPLSGGGAPAPPERRGDPGERAGVSEGNGYTLRAASAPQAGDAPSSAVILRRISTDEKHALLRACFRLSKNPRRAREGRSPLELPIVPGGVYGGKVACLKGKQVALPPPGRFLRRQIPFSRAKIVSLQFLRPEI